MQFTNQIQILHFSDLHFGSQHICNPDPPNGSSDGIPQLHELILNDLEGKTSSQFCGLSPAMTNECPLIIAVTGDFTQKAEAKEFEQALTFLNAMVNGPLLSQEVSKSDVFMIPGNHDVLFNEELAKTRFQPYCSFYNEYFEKFRSPILSHEPLAITQLHYIEKGSSKILLAEVNCCMYVHNDSVEKSRGQVSQAAISKLRAELVRVQAAVPFDDCIKIAMIHHHVVLLPSFIEANKGLDSIVNARDLLELLSEFNFHLILHGHKHYPQIFSYDPLPLWTENEQRIPQVVIAGGSCGSKELPESESSRNTYSVITIKWHPTAKQARIRVVTRGLKRLGQRGPLAPGQWEWDTINTSDKVIQPYKTLPNVGYSEIDEWSEDQRQERYEHLRFQMPVVEVLPSLVPGQAYEARAWITPHGPPLPVEKELIRVEWSAGSKFPRQSCTKERNPSFCVGFHYWGPMQIEAKLTFHDGYVAYGFVYARMPKNESNEI